MAYITKYLAWVTLKVSLIGWELPILKVIKIYFSNEIHSKNINYCCHKNKMAFIIIIC